MNLTEFLLARITEDEANDTTLIGVARKDWTARWATECEARRRRVELICELSHPVAAPQYVVPLLRLEALPYADHPDFDESWSV